MERLRGIEPFLNLGKVSYSQYTRAAKLAWSFCPPQGAFPTVTGAWSLRLQNRRGVISAPQTVVQTGGSPFSAPARRDVYNLPLELERSTGFEPVRSAWKADMLAVNISLA